MKSISTKSDSPQPAADTAVYLFDDWFDPIEAGVRDRVREFIQAMVEGELDATLMRRRYGRRPKSTSDDDDGLVAVTGHRHGHRSRSLTGTFGRVEIEVPRARLHGQDGKTTEWSSKVLRAYQRRTLAADALIASTYLAGTNTRRVRRALAALFGGTVSKDIVSRVWRKVKGDWDAWNARSLAAEPIVRLILDGTVVRVRLDRKATSISLLVVIGVRADGQKVLLAVKNMGGESTEAWRAVLDDLIKRGLQRPEFLIVDGALGLETAIAAVWDGVPMQRCTVHKHRNLLAHAPERLHDEVTAARPSSASGGSSVERLPIASKKLATTSSLSRACRRASGEAQEQRTRSSVCTKSSSGGLRRRPCCRRPIRRQCCSGRCSPLVKSTCARLTVGRPSPPHNKAINRLTSPPDSVLSKCRRSRQQIPTQFATAPAVRMEALSRR